MTAKKKITGKAAAAAEPRLYFKGLDKEFKGRGYQFEVGQTYAHEGQINICHSGFHACANPLDVLNYYPLYDSRFASVIALAEFDRDGKCAGFATGRVGSDGIPADTWLKASGGTLVEA